MINLLAVAFVLQDADTPVLKPIRISPKTTYITEPLDENGHVDYVEALNQRYQKASDTNANAAFRRVLGTADNDEAFGRDSYFQRLGISADFPDTTFIDDSAFAQTSAVARADVQRELRAITKQPWTSTDYSFSANWVTANAKALEQLRLALQKPEWYEPLGPEGSRVMQVHTPQDSRTAVRLIAASAMYQIGNKNKDRVWRDVIACHRLGSHIAQGPTIIEGLVGYVSNYYGRAAEFAFLSHIRAPASILDRYEAQLRAVRPPKPMYERWNETERFAFLDTVCALHRGDAQKAVFGDKNAATLTAIRETRPDFNKILIAGNAWFDKLAAAGAEPAGLKRILAVEKVQAELAKEPQGLQPAEAATRTILKLLFHPRTLTAGVTAETQYIMRERLSRVAWALRRYADTHKQYPDELKQLESDKFRVPLDPFSDKPFFYSLNPDGGCAIYSVSVNRKDDAGTEPERGVTDYDYVVRLKK